MIRTTDPDKMKKEVSSLSPYGGDDAPEMCLSGLQVRPTGCLQDRNIVEVSYLKDLKYNYSSSWHSPEPPPPPTSTFLLTLQPKTSTSRTLLLHSSGAPSPQ